MSTATVDELRGAIVRSARRALLAALLRRGTATADDARTWGEIPAAVNPKCMGAVPMPLVRLGIIRAAGHVRTGRRIAHGRTLTLWRLADPTAARRWLTDHRNEATPTAGTAGAAAF